MKKNEVTTIDEARQVLSGVRRAAMAAGRRMAALENQAEAIHQETLTRCAARVVCTRDNGISALISDGRTTIEVNGGAISVAVKD